MSKNNLGRLANIHTARGTALYVLCRVETDASYSGTLLQSLLYKYNLSSTDKALATRLCYGTLQKRIYIDYLLENVGGRRINSLDVAARNILRIGAYQLLFCDKIPASAAVNESVKLAKEGGFASCAGLVNAVLRKLSTTSVSLSKEDTAELGVTYSLPRWLCESLHEWYPDEPLEEMLAALDVQPKIYLRVNNTLTDTDALIDVLANEGVTARKTNLPHALEICGTFLPDELASFHQGLYHVQDTASQYCVMALDAHPGQRILDICAAPGGKSFTAAEYAFDCAEVVSCDLYEVRTQLIKEGARRLGLTSVAAATVDATMYRESLGTYDRIICDVPCSGLGVIRRKPEIRFKPHSELYKYPELQLRILENAIRYLKIGGRIIYSTCTLNPEENTGVIRQMLLHHPEMMSVPLYGACGQRQRTFFPHKDGTDGFFCAAFIKTDNGDN